MSECWDVIGDYVDEETERECVTVHGEGGVCPLCCGSGGCYEPGTEECDFCDWASECGELGG